MTGEHADSMVELRSRVDDLMRRDARLYWTDLLVSASVGWGTFAWATTLEWGMPRAALTLLCCFAMLRAVLFIHEIAHLTDGELPGFTTAFNAVVGVPLGVPSFMYTTHADHHRRHLFGTVRDPEYLPLALLPRWHAVFFVLHTLAAPVGLLARWIVLSPLSWLVPPLRRLVVGRLSALVVNPRYERPEIEDAAARRAWFILEALLLLWFGGWAIAMATGWVPWTVGVQWAVVAAGVACINQFRTLSAHLYEMDGRELGMREQLTDSINLRGFPIATGLIAPVGLKFHALHHVMPDMPYHSLGAAHRRLMSELPDDSPYRRTERTGLVSVTLALFRRRRAAGAADRWANGGSSA